MRAAQSRPDGIMDVMNQSLVFWEVVTLAVAIATIVVLALVVRSLISRGSAAGPARYILDERYAKGEIGREEYEQKRRDLRR